MRVAAFYTYYDRPYLLRRGDDVRIVRVARDVARGSGSAPVFVVLDVWQEGASVVSREGMVFLELRRPFYRALRGLLRGRAPDIFDPISKATKPADELYAALKLGKLFEKADVVYVFGSMSFMPFFLRAAGARARVYYDALSYYAQTFYLRSRSEPTALGRAINLAKYALYVSFLRLLTRHVDVFVYPSELDRENARRALGLGEGRAVVIPNPLPFSFEDEEYRELRARHRSGEVPHFLLLAGGRGRINYEAVRETIRIFNELPPEKFRLFVTGPWKDLAPLVRNPSIRLLGLLPHEELKAYLAACDYGLSPIFIHASGTFVKVLAYISGRLSVIASPQSLAGLDASLLRATKIYVVRSYEEYAEVIRRLVAGPMSGGHEAGGGGAPLPAPTGERGLLGEGSRETAPPSGS
ncbi:MAG: glycosyltransferase [Desulfurococcaceae archaeon]